MAYPIDDLTNVHLNASTDDPSQARVELNALLLKVQAMIAATGTGANNALKLDSNGDVPTGVSLSDSLPIAGGGTGAATAPAALVNLGLTATANQINYNVVSTLGIVEASKTVTANASNGVNFGHISVLPSVTGGSATVYTVTTGITAYETNRVYEVRVNATNTASCTINFDSLGAKTIKTLAGDTLIAGQLPIKNIAKLHYDGTDMILMNPENVAIAFRVYLSSSQLNIGTVAEKVNWDAETYDTNSDFDTTTNYRFTPTVAGKYLLSVEFYWTSLASGNILTVYFYKNGASIKQSRKGAPNTIYSPSLVDTVDANGSTDYFEVFVKNASSTTSDLQGSGSGTNNVFTGLLIGV